MKIAKQGVNRPITNLVSVLSGAASGVSAGQAPVSSGSNGVSWQPIVQTISAGGSNALGPFVNFAAGSNMTITIDQGPLGSGSNTLRFHSTGGGGGGFTQSYVGYDTVGASNEAPANRKILAKKVTTSGAVELLTIDVHLKSNSSTPGALAWGVWEDNAGVPRTLLAAVNTPAAGMLYSPGSDRYRWVALPIGVHLSASTSYWIGVMFDGSEQIKYDTSGSDHTITSGGWWIPDWDFYADSDTTKRYSIRGSVVSSAGGGGGGGAPTTVDYLVGTADATLSAEIVVGPTPGGELGGTWASPTVDTIHSGSAHPGFGAAVAPGTVTLATERFLVQYTHLKIASTDRMTMAGTSRVILDDLLTDTQELILGTPKIASSFVVPSDYVLDQLTRLTLREANRATLRGTADLVLTDDFGTRSRIVLAGRG